MNPSLEQICKKEKIVIKKVRKPKFGISNDISIVNEKFVIRINAKGFAQEINHLLLLAKHKIPVPRIYSFGRKYLILEYIPSKTLSECPSILAYRKLGRLLKKMHSIEKKTPEFARYLRRVRRRALVAKIPKGAKEFIRNYTPKISRSTFVHHDPSPSNFLVDKRGKLYIIDLEWSTYGDPLYDVAMIQVKHPPEYFRAFLKEYGGRIDKKRILYYQLLHELNIVRWAKKHKKTALIKIKEKSVAKIVSKIKRYSK